MKKAILATKVGMTQIFNADGVLVPVTVLQAGPCVVTQIKTVDNDGYSAVQVGFVDKKEKTVNKDANGKKEIRNRHGVNKAQMGHFAKAGVSGKRFVREFKFENADEYKLADESRYACIRLHFFIYPALSSSSMYALNFSLDMPNICSSINRSL